MASPRRAAPAPPPPSRGAQRAAPFHPKSPYTDAPARERHARTPPPSRLTAGGSVPWRRPQPTGPLITHETHVPASPYQTYASTAPALGTAGVSPAGWAPFRPPSPAHPFPADKPRGRSLSAPAHYATTATAHHHQPFRYPDGYAATAQPSYPWGPTRTTLSSATQPIGAQPRDPPHVQWVTRTAPPDPDDPWVRLMGRASPTTFAIVSPPCTYAAAEAPTYQAAAGGAEPPSAGASVAAPPPAPTFSGPGTHAVFLSNIRPEPYAPPTARPLELPGLPDGPGQPSPSTVAMLGHITHPGSRPTRTTHRGPRAVGYASLDARPLAPRERLFLPSNEQPHLGTGAAWPPPTEPVAPVPAAAVPPPPPSPPPPPPPGPGLPDAPNPFEPPEALAGHLAAGRVAFQAVDRNGNGRVSLADLAYFLAQEGAPLRTTELTQAFALADREEQGVLDFNGFLRLLAYIQAVEGLQPISATILSAGLRSSAAPPSPPPDNGPGTPPPVGEAPRPPALLPEEETSLPLPPKLQAEVDAARAHFLAMDTDGDGRISALDYACYMSRMTGLAIPVAEAFHLMRETNPDSAATVDFNGYLRMAVLLNNSLTVRSSYAAMLASPPWARRGDFPPSPALREVEAHFRAADRDRDGYLTPAECAAALTRVGFPVTETEVREALTCTARLGGGLVDLPQFLEVLVMLDPARRRPPPIVTVAAAPSAAPAPSFSSQPSSAPTISTLSQPSSKGPEGSPGATHTLHAIDGSPGRSPSSRFAVNGTGLNGSPGGGPAPPRTELQDVQHRAAELRSMLLDVHRDIERLQRAAQCEASTPLVVVEGLDEG